MRIAKLISVVGALAFVGAATLMFFPSTATAQEPLRWKFEKGEKLEYDTNQEVTMNVKGAPVGEVTMTTQQQMDMTWEVLDVDSSGTATIRQRVDRVRLKMSAPMGPGLEYDSDAKEPPAGNAAMVAGMFEAMKKGEFELTLTPRGELKSAKVPDEVMAAFKNSPQAAQFGELMTPEAIQKMIMQEVIVLPENAVSPGETWTAKSELAIPAAGKQTVDTTYKYEGTKDIENTTYSVISSQRKLDFANAENQGLQMTIKDQSFSGEALFNAEAGRLNSVTQKQTLTMDASAGGQTIEQKLDQKSEVKISPAGAAESEAKSTESESAIETKN